MWLPSCRAPKTKKSVIKTEVNIGLQGSQYFCHKTWFFLWFPILSPILRYPRRRLPLLVMMLKSSDAPKLNVGWHARPSSADPVGGSPRLPEHTRCGEWTSLCAAGREENYGGYGRTMRAKRGSSHVTFLQMLKMQIHVWLNRKKSYT